MTNLQSINTLEERISRRIFILSSIDNIIEESSYYRTHAGCFNTEKIILGNVKNSEIKCKIL